MHKRSKRGMSLGFGIGVSLMFLLLALFAGASTAAAATPPTPAANAAFNVRISNVSDTSFTVSWTSNTATTGSVNYQYAGQAANLSSQVCGLASTPTPLVTTTPTITPVPAGSPTPSATSTPGFAVANDARGSSTSSIFHYVTISGLIPDSTYQFTITTGTTTDDNNGSMYTAYTAPTQGGTSGPPAPPVILSGSANTVSSSNVTAPANGGIVYFRIEDLGATTGATYCQGEISSYISALVSSTGQWQLPVQALSPDLQQPITWSASGDKLLLEAVAPLGTSTVWTTGQYDTSILPTSGSTNLGAINIGTIGNQSNSIVLGWNPIALSSMTVNPLTFEELAQSYDVQDMTATFVAQWSGGSWVIHTAGSADVASTDTLVPGNSAMVRIDHFNLDATTTATPVTYQRSGLAVVSPVQVCFSNSGGWQSVSVPFAPVTYDAESMGQSILSQHVSADFVAAWVNGQWQPHQIGTNANLFTIASNTGYLVDTLQYGGGCWQPGLEITSTPTVTTGPGTPTVTKTATPPFATHTATPTPATSFTATPTHAVGTLTPTPSRTPTPTLTPTMTPATCPYNTPTNNNATAVATPNITPLATPASAGAINYGPTQNLAFTTAGQQIWFSVTTSATSNVEFEAFNDGRLANVVMTLYDSTGTTVLAGPVTATNATGSRVAIDQGSLVAGTYLIKLTQSDGMGGCGGYDVRFRMNTYN